MHPSEVGVWTTTNLNMHTWTHLKFCPLHSHCWTCTFSVKPSWTLTYCSIGIMAAAFQTKESARGWWLQQPLMHSVHHMGKKLNKVVGHGGGCQEAHFCRPYKQCGQGHKLNIWAIRTLFTSKRQHAWDSLIFHSGYMRVWMSGEAGGEGATAAFVLHLLLSYLMLYLIFIDLNDG